MEFIILAYQQKGRNPQFQQQQQQAQQEHGPSRPHGKHGGLHQNKQKQ